MRVLHFSDIHVTCPHLTFGAFFDKRLLGTMNYLVNRRNQQHAEYLAGLHEQVARYQPDLVICTGDITCIGAPIEFEQAVQSMQPIASDSRWSFVWVPGNHDAYVKAASHRKALENAFEHLNGFSIQRAREELVELRIKDCAFFPLCEAMPTNIVMSSGKLCQEQAERLAQRLEQSKQSEQLRAVVGHFPVRREDGTRLHWKRKLYGHDTIHQALRTGKLDLAFSGHIHDGYCREYASGAKEVCAGALTVTGLANLVSYDKDQAGTQQKWVQLVKSKS